ncbi:flagellar hook-length control protein FliK [Bosea caraganae]|uniref:Flagellar hook-length control protein FliK n=1 Tax=Bosea caraganae TaxID=2763117 RepID=A0A370LBU1_9HYPH|nr:flagellar hook-length control protein FliK [Bosea caraganae]RDJ27410.1 flagellar hook-length control protein FliK [Bosea caraganae]RDJ29426.1 flagellar hook-length control protein FliK [Bosea caraganae]
MNRLDTPLGPEASVTKSGAAGKDLLKRLGGRDERGSAFGAMLKALDPKKPVVKPDAADDADKAGDKVPAPPRDDARAKAADDILATPPAAAAPEQAVSGESAAARLLLGPFQPAESEAPPPAGKDAGPRETPVMAALTGVLDEMARTLPREGRAAGFARPEQPPQPGAAGIAMPSQDKAPAADLSLLSRLADVLKDPAAAKDIATAQDAAESTAPLARPHAKDDDQNAAPGPKPEGGPGPLTIAVTHQETHLPPVTRLSPFQQVVEPIRQAAAELVASLRGSDAIPELDSLKPSEISSPTKLLHLELRPVELGTITVKMRLSQGGMELRIEASRPETAALLSQDKEALREIIRASGYSPDAVSVETVHVDAAPGDWQRAQHRQDAPQNPTPDGRDGGRGFSEFRQGEQGREAPRQSRTPDAPLSKDEPHDMAETGRAGGDPHLYL